MIVHGKSLADMLIGTGMVLKNDGGKQSHTWCDYQKLQRLASDARKEYTRIKTVHETRERNFKGKRPVSNKTITSIRPLNATLDRLIHQIDTVLRNNINVLLRDGCLSER